MKPTDKSRRHHYIPQFFIKNFANDDGLLFVYNKEKDSFLKNKQSPKSLFFENDRNTVSFSGEQLDNLEQMYSTLDSSLAKDYRNVLKTKTATPEEVASLFMLANLLRWRIPKSDEKFNLLKNDLSQEDLKITIQIKSKEAGLNHAAMAHIENSDIFKETKRVMLSILPLLHSNKLLDFHNYSFIQNNSLFPSLIGDCPILMENEHEDREIGNFIFPLSSDTTFIYKQDSDREILNGLFFLHRDLSILHNSTKLIGCKDKSHLEKIVDTYKQIKLEKNLHNLEKYAFSFIK